MSDIDHLQEREGEWQLSFIVDKCKVMHLGVSHNTHAKYFMKGRVLQETAEEKDKQ
jgi:hypothetical protein